MKKAWVVARGRARERGREEERKEKLSHNMSNVKRVWKEKIEVP